MGTLLLKSSLCVLAPSVVKTLYRLMNVGFNFRLV